MPYIIDGHNLIGALPDISLHDPEDERQLITRLQAFLSRNRKRAVLYFDDRAPGARAFYHTPNLQVRFVGRPRSADDAIRDHIERLGREATNWTVVSTDRAVRSLARRSGAVSMTSQAFAAQMSRPHDLPADAEKPSAPASEGEIAAWERLFNQDLEE
jgi:predicted RNA-binding protein with PIN domain